VPVNLRRPPHAARLYIWGRDQVQWWGGIGFRQPIVTAAGLPAELSVAAWVPASAIGKPTWSKAEVALPRIDLPADQRQWPAPDLAPVWFVGAWANGDLVTRPGLTLDPRPRWRRR
jgi:hypothetical protein